MRMNTKFGRKLWTFRYLIYGGNLESIITNPKYKCFNVFLQLLNFVILVGNDQGPSFDPGPDQFRAFSESRSR